MLLQDQETVFDWVEDALMDEGYYFTMRSMLQ